jgi:hypothetical protein
VSEDPGPSPLTQDCGGHRRKTSFANRTRPCCTLVWSPTQYGKGWYEVRAAAKALGVVGGVFGIIFGIVALLVGGMGVAFAAEGGATVGALGFIAILLAIAAIVGGALANGHRLASTILLLVPGVIGFVCISVFWILPGILLIVGGALEILARGKAPAPVAAAFVQHPGQAPQPPSQQRVEHPAGKPGW